jgi:hypothetical protein
MEEMRKRTFTWAGGGIGGSPVFWFAPAFLARARKLDSVLGLQGQGLFGSKKTINSALTRTCTTRGL